MSNFINFYNENQKNYYRHNSPSYPFNKHPETRIQLPLTHFNNTSQSIQNTSNKLIYSPKSDAKKFLTHPIPGINRSPNQIQSNYYQNILHQYQREIQQLRKQLITLRGNIEYKSSKNSEKNDNYFKLSSVTKDSEKDTHLFKKKSEDDRLREYQESTWRNTRLQQADEKIRILNEKLHEAEISISILKNQSNTNRMRYDSQLARIKQIVIRYEQELKLRSSLEKQNQKLKELLQIQKIEKEKEIHILNQKFDQERRKQFLSGEMLENCQNQLSYYQSQNNSLKQEINRMQEQHLNDKQKLRLELIDTEGKLQNQDVQHMNNYKRLQLQSMRLNTQLEQKNKKIYDLQVKLQKIRNDSQKQTLIQQNNQNQLIRQLQSVNNDKFFLLHELESHKNNFNKLEIQNQQLKQFCNQCNRKFQTMFQENEQMKKILAELKHKDYVLEQKLKEANNVIIKKDQVNIVAKDQVFRFQNKADKISQSKQQIIKQNQLLKEQINLLLIKCQQLDTNYMNLYHRVSKNLTIISQFPRPAMINNGLIAPLTERINASIQSRIIKEQQKFNDVILQRNKSKLKI